MSDSELSTAPPASIASSKNPWSQFTGVRSISKASSVSTAVAQHTRNFSQKRPVITVKPPPKRRRARSNATEEDLEATQARNIEQFYSDDNAELVDDLEGSEPAESPSLQPTSGVSQSTSRSSSVSNDRKPKRGPRSEIWNYYRPIDINGSNGMRCIYCTTSYRFSGGTNYARKHLLKEHGVDSASQKTALIARYNEHIDQALLRQPELDRQRKDREVLKHLADGVNKQHFEHLYMRWTILADIGFTQVADINFRAFLGYINAPANQIVTLLTRYH